MSIKTLLFDLDGTLIDTNELIVRSFVHTFDQFKPGEFTRESVVNFMGPPLLETMQKVDMDRAEEMIDVYRAFNHEHHDALVTAFPNVYQTLEALHEKGYKMAIVTTKIRKTALMGLALTGLDQFFDVVVGLDDVTRAKPETEPLEKALDLLGVEKEGAVMIGDSPHDIGAGQNLGIETIGVSWTLKGIEAMRSWNPDYIIDSMDELLPLLEQNQ